MACRMTPPAFSAVVQEVVPMHPDLLPPTPLSGVIPAASASPAPPASCQDSGMPAIIRRSQEAFRRDLPRLLRSRKRYRQWVAYHGDEQIGFAATNTKLYHECYRRGLKDGEFFVRCVLPEMSDDEDSTPMHDV